MNKTTFFTALSLFTLLFAACQQTPESKPAAQETPKPDMGKIKAEIQALENDWAKASTVKDVATIVAFYADDAVSMSNNKPMITGKAAIQKEVEEEFAKRKEASVVAFETLNVFGNENLVTETGKTTSKNAAGEVIYDGKYMAVWEKRNGKWLVISDIYNDDAKEK
jgi:uncharacterized protein (TIGR02246 family)